MIPVASNYFEFYKKINYYMLLLAMCKNLTGEDLLILNSSVKPDRKRWANYATVNHQVGEMNKTSFLKNCNL